MPIPIGSRLGPYEILSSVGAGGMGEVYHARDTRLDRSVAVKILPAEFASNEELRLRFEREAKAISQLSHPNICTLHDVGHAAAATSGTGETPDTPVHYLVMEYLEGENLSVRLARGRLPLAEALRVGIELASALDCAHRAGVIHRDLKPANVILAKGGAKLVDFGLARTGLSPRARQHEATVRLESEGPLTERGTVLGTLQYMAPEQLSGDDIDARADIFALGVLLYEALSGRRAFEATSVAGLMTAVLATDPQPIRELQPDVPVALERLVTAMLAKDREQRIQTVHDVRLQLQWILESLSQPGIRGAVASAAPRGRGRAARLVAIGAVSALVVALAAMAMLRRVPDASVPPLVRFSVPAPADFAYVDSVAVSNDGRSIAYSLGSLGGRSSLWIRGIDRDEPRQLSGTEGAYGPFFSPDGRRLGFFSSGHLRKIDLETGEVEPVCETRGYGGATWGRDVILFAPLYESEIWRVDASGGSPVKVTQPGASGLHIWPHFLPDGVSYLYAAWAPGGGGIMARRLDSDTETMLRPYSTVNELTMPRYADGTLFFVKDQSLFGQPFDPRSLSLSGTPRRITEGLRHHGPGWTPYAVSTGGTAAWLPDVSNEQTELLLVNHEGKVLHTVGEPSDLLEFRASPDGDLVAAAIDEPGMEPTIWLIDIARGSRTRAITVDGWAGAPVWLPDSTGFVFTRTSDGPPNLHRVILGRGIERLSTSPWQQKPTSIAPDGTIVIDTLSAETQYDVSVLLPDGTLRPLLSGRFNEDGGQVSRDGKWIAFASNESGRYEIYVTSFPEPGRLWRISADGGRIPHWSTDGQGLYFLSGGRLMHSRVTATDRIEATLPTLVFDLGIADFNVLDDDRILVARRQLNPSRPPLRVMSGWQNLVLD